MSSGGRNFVRGMPSKIFEAGLARRTVVVEFDNLAAAISAYESPAYQAARELPATRLFGISGLSKAPSSAGRQSGTSTSRSKRVDYNVQPHSGWRTPILPSGPSLVLITDCLNNARQTSRSPASRRITRANCPPSISRRTAPLVGAVVSARPLPQHQRREPGKPASPGRGRSC